ncbi:hypothetical protein PY365_13945 [Roseiarcaceae bacterium H3SJ34-1]|uniref:hypothetical protein n=1 Tax=Terripilifer ovatus TaxID=3032367 RepID=UPI003AB93573|nr:hypothetical protein [Roseiarcaceae bacterium H3SJ34-1]
MSFTPNHFYDSITDVSDVGTRELVSFFVYFLTENQNEDAATAGMIEKCFHDCNLTPPGRISQYLSEGISRKEYVKHYKGYRLQRHYLEKLATRLNATKPKIQSYPELRKLEARVTGLKKAFLSETIDCFEAGANRATIIMCWILALDHLCEHIFAKHLSTFNAELAKVTDKRVKASQIRTRDDFSDIPENKLIELMRSSGVISNDVRKILDEKLSVRNSCAHPSGIVVKPSRVIDFVDDLIENVVLKYN